MSGYIGRQRIYLEILKVEKYDIKLGVSMVHPMLVGISTYCSWTTVDFVSDHSERNNKIKIIIT